jgi:hypothetical protein
VGNHLAGANEAGVGKYKEDAKENGPNPGVNGVGHGGNDIEF